MIGELYVAKDRVNIRDRISSQIICRNQVISNSVKCDLAAPLHIRCAPVVCNYEVTGCSRDVQLCT